MNRIAAAVLAAIAVVCGFLALRSDGAPAASSSPSSLGTPVWSVRRLPQPVVDAVGAQRLQSAVDDAIGGANGCAVVTDGSGTIATHNADVPLVGASTQKLLVSAAILDALGPDYRFETKAVGAAAPADGTLDHLWLVGAGDPFLSTADFPARLGSDPRAVFDHQATGDASTMTSLDTLADSIVAAGVKHIPGGVDGDDSRFESVRYQPSWPDSDRTDPQVGPLGALTVNHGYSDFAPKLVPSSDPALLAATELTQLLRSRGVTVGDPGHSPAPAGATDIASVKSATLHDLVGGMLRASDNLAAELFTRELGAQVAHAGTTAAGDQAIVAGLQKLGVPTDGVTLVDGSGLSHDDRLTCRALATVIALGSQPRFAALWDGLAVAGQSGTLFDQFLGTPLAGKLHGKTGSLTGVTGLVATIDLGRALRFAYVANGNFSEGNGERMRSDVAELVATFPDAPAANDLVPLPASSSPPPSPPPSSSPSP